MVFSWKYGFCLFRFLWKLWPSCRASSRMWDSTQTRKPSTLCLRSSICPNTPSLSSSRTSATTSSTTDASKSWVTGPWRVEVWTSVTTERRSCSQAQKTQSPARMERKRFSSPRREPTQMQGFWFGPHLPTPLRHPQEPTRLRRRTRLTLRPAVLWLLGARRLAPESRWSSRGRDRFSETIGQSQQRLDEQLMWAVEAARMEYCTYSHDL